MKDSAVGHYYQDIYVHSVDHGFLTSVPLQIFSLYSVLQITWEVKLKTTGKELYFPHSHQHPHKTRLDTHLPQSLLARCQEIP